MNAVKKLVASGMDAAEAERIAAILEAPDEPTEPAKPTEPTEPAKPAEPTEPAEPAEPTGPDEPAEPTEPDEPAEPDDAAKPDEPTEPAEPAEPAEPTEPVEPAEPTEPVEPAELEGPDLATQNAELRARLIAAELTSAGLAAGVKAERLPTLAKLVDTSAIDITGTDAARQIADAISAALQEVPELVAVPFTGALGAHPRNNPAPDPFARGLMG